MTWIKRVFVAILFVVMVVIVLIPLSYSLRPLELGNGDTRRRIAGFYAEEDNSIEVVVVGGSGVYRYVNNPYLWKSERITSYNLGFSALSIYLLEDLVDELCKTQTPKVVIVDARKFLLTETEEIDDVKAQRVINNVKYSWERCRMINKVYSAPIDRFNNYFDIILYHSNYAKFSRENLQYLDNENPNPLKGFEPVDKVVNLEYIDVTEVTGEEPLSEPSERALRSLLEKCQKENVEIMLLSTPWQITEEYQKRSNYLKDIVDEYGFHYLDMNAVVDEVVAQEGLDWSTDFYDDRHVNVYGSEKVTAYVGRYLREHYQFDEDYDETLLESWDKALERYEKELIEFGDK